MLQIINRNAVVKERLDTFMRAMLHRIHLNVNHANQQPRDGGFKILGPIIQGFRGRLYFEVRPCAGIQALTWDIITEVIINLLAYMNQSEEYQLMDFQVFRQGATADEDVQLASGTITVKFVTEQGGSSFYSLDIL